VGLVCCAILRCRCFAPSYQCLLCHNRPGPRRQWAWSFMLFCIAGALHLATSAYFGVSVCGVGGGRPFRCVEGTLCGRRRGTESMQGSMQGSADSLAALVECAPSYQCVLLCGISKSSLLASCCCAHSWVSAAVPALAAAAEPACASAVAYLGPRSRHVKPQWLCVVSNNPNRVFV
jgi:hypothetical protein